MFRSNQTVMPWCLTVCAVIAIGCGLNDSPSSVPVSGEIWIDGVPLQYAEVHYYSEDVSSVGTTNEDGYYELLVGAKPGMNRVYVSKWEGDAGVYDPSQGIDMGQMEAAAAAGPANGKQSSTPKQLIPVKYSDPQQTELEIMVPAGGTESANFKLTSK